MKSYDDPRVQALADAVAAGPAPPAPWPGTSPREESLTAALRAAFPDCGLSPRVVMLPRVLTRARIGLVVPERREWCPLWDDGDGVALQALRRAFRAYLDGVPVPKGLRAPAFGIVPDMEDDNG